MAVPAITPEIFSQTVLFLFLTFGRRAHHLLIRTSLHGSGRVGMFVSKNRLIPIVFPPIRGMCPLFHKKLSGFITFTEHPMFPCNHFFLNGGTICSVGREDEFLAWVIRYNYTTE